MRPSLLQFQMMLSAGANRVYATWNPSDMGGNMQLSNGNSRVSAIASSSSDALVRSTIPIVGDVYFEIVINQASAVGGEVIAGGVADASASLSSYVGSATTSTGVWQPNGNVYGGGAVVGNAGTNASATRRYYVAVKASTREVWVCLDGGAWVGGGDPAAGTSPTYTLGGSGDVYAAATASYLVGAYVDLVSDPANFVGSAPAGFTPGLFA